MLAHDARADPPCRRRRARRLRGAVRSRRTRREPRRDGTSERGTTRRSSVRQRPSSRRRARADAIARAAARASGTPRNSGRFARARSGGAPTRRRRLRGTSPPVPPPPPWDADTGHGPCACARAPRLGQAKVELRAEQREAGAPAAQSRRAAGAAAETEKDGRDRGGRAAKPTFAATRFLRAAFACAARVVAAQGNHCAAGGTTPRFTVRCSTCSKAPSCRGRAVRVPRTAVDVFCSAPPTWTRCWEPGEFLHLRPGGASR